MKVVLRTTMFMVSGALYMASNAVAMASPQHNHIRQGATTTISEEEDNEQSCPEQHQHQQPAPLSHLRHPIPFSFTNNSKSGDSDFLRFLAEKPLEIELDENCEPAAMCPCDEAWFSSVKPLNKATCSTEKNMKFLFKDKMPPEIQCDYKKPQCKGKVPVPLVFCTDFKNRKHKPHAFTVKDNCADVSSSNVPDLLLKDDLICTTQKFTRTYTANDGCNKAKDVTLTFSVDPPTIDVTLPATATAQCKDGSFLLPELTGTQTVCGVTEEIKAKPTGGNSKKCDTVTVAYTYQDKCKHVSTQNVQFTFTGSNLPLFLCRSTGDCPPDETVCSVPSDLTLCAKDCKWGKPKCVFPTQKGNFDVCNGGKVTQTWQVQDDGCGNKGDKYKRKLTILAQRPGEPYLKINEPNPGCGEKLIFCVDVPVCDDGQETQTRCSDDEMYASHFEATLVSGSTTASICSSNPSNEGEDNSGNVKESVTYTDPETGCESSTEIEYTIDCCCEKAWAFSNSAQNPPSTCFKNIEDVKKDWGWSIGPIKQPYSGKSTSTLAIYAAAKKCNLSYGYLAGQATITYRKSGEVKVEVTAEYPALFTIAHIYVGKEILPTIDETFIFTAEPNNLGYISPEYKEGTAGPISYSTLPKTFTGDIYVAVHTASALSCTAPYYQ
ncbi:hypothetical protein ACA910_003929 [Epithemia clementina (nom. ined.)]